jgi:hypothetical protein
MYAKSSIKKISVLSKADPLPVLPPNLRADLGEGECAIFFEDCISWPGYCYAPPPIVPPAPLLVAGSIGGGQGGGRNARLVTRPREDGQRGDALQGRFACVERVIE